MATATMERKRAAHWRKKRPSWESLQEYSAGGAGVVDREAGVIFNVRILGASSLNGRRYTEACVADALGLYEGTVVNFDHPSRKDPDAETPVSARAGWLQNVRVVNGGLTGNLHLLKSDPRADKVFEAAEVRPELFGLSHNVEGRTQYKNGMTVVDKILRVKSVDIVSDPASTRSLFETGGKGVNLAKAAELLWGDYPGTSGAACPTRLTETKPAKKRLAKKKKKATSLGEAVAAVFGRKGVRHATKMEAIRMMVSGNSKTKSRNAKQFVEAVTESGRTDKAAARRFAGRISDLREIVDEGVVDEAPLDAGPERRSSVSQGETSVGWQSSGFVQDAQKLFDEGLVGPELEKRLKALATYWCSKLAKKDADSDLDAKKRQALGVKESRRGGKSADAAAFYRKVTGETIPRRAIVESRGRSGGGKSVDAQDFFKRVTV